MPHRACHIEPPLYDMRKDIYTMFDTYLMNIQSDEFATEWEDFCVALDEAMILHIEEEN